MKNFRKTKNCYTCLYCHEYETKKVRVSERLSQEYFTYFCSQEAFTDLETPAITTCDDWEYKDDIGK